MKVLLDTCVIVDVLQERQPFSDAAKELFFAVANQKVDGFLSAKSVCDIYYLTHRITHSDAKTRSILNALLGLFSILDTTAIDCRKALSSPAADYEDAVMCETAERCEMDYIVTRNERDYRYSSVLVVAPEELNRLLDADLNR